MGYVPTIRLNNLIPVYGCANSQQDFVAALGTSFDTAVCGNNGWQGDKELRSVLS